ncbi:MAG: hypothetical protein II882_08895 [Lachnospiraceae bacterium]|nr:hypothetical protein [Lachnospiraceae bacterium]
MKTQTYYYTEGNTVRRTAMPLPEQEDELLQLPQQEARRRRTLRPLELVYTMLLAGLVVMFGLLCFHFLRANASLTASRNNIYRLENRLAELKADNNTTQNRLEAQTDLKEVYRVATEELGMVYPDNNEHILFDSQAREYVRQYEDIPRR